MLGKHLNQGVLGLARALLAGLALLFIFPAAALADTDSAGNVIAARRDAWAERGRAKPQLYSKSPVFSGDRLSTNPVGRLQVLFNDDSVLMLAQDSQATITEYVYAGESGNSFNIRLAKGVTNLISGRMVENEPGSMRVETPEITVGIQGTSLAVETSGGISKVMIGHATPGLPTIVICGEDQRKTYLEESGMVLIMNAEAQCVPEIRRITPDEQFFLRNLSLPLSGPGLAETAGPVDQLLGPPAQPVLLAQLPPALQNTDGGSILQPDLPDLPTQNFAGTYTGTLSGNWLGGSLDGVFNLGVAGLDSNPTVNTFGMFVTDGISSSIETHPTMSVNAPLTNGRFDLDISGLDKISSNLGGSPVLPQITVDGNIANGNVDLNWQYDAGSGPSQSASGTGSGQKGDYQGW